MSLFVFGHKSPDTDSICSAVSLAYLKNKLGVEAKAYALEEPRKAFVLSISRGILFVLLSLFVCTTLFKKNGIWISCTVSDIFCLGIALYDLKTQKKI